MYLKSIWYSIAQTCLISFLIFQIKCEKQYELNCLNKDCSGILFEGFSQFVHPEDSDLIKLGKNEFLQIYGENDEFYLIQKQNRKGLVKKSYVKITKTMSKDQPLMKIRTSFTNKKLNLIDFNENQIENNGSSIEFIENSDLNESQSNPSSIHLDQIGEENISSENFNEVKINLDEIASVSSKDEQANEPTIETAKIKSKFLDVPLVQKLHHHNIKTDQSESNVENLNLKEPEIQNFSKNETLDSTKQTNESINDASDKKVENLVNEPINQIVNENLDVINNQSTNVDQSNDLNKQINQTDNESIKNNEDTLSESIDKSQHINVSNDKKEEQINKFELNNDDLDALKNSYKESTEKQDTPPLKLKEFENESKEVPSSPNSPTEPLINENLASNVNSIDKVQHVNEELTNLDSINKVDHQIRPNENVLANEPIAKDLYKKEIEIKENDQKLMNDELLSTDSISAEQSTNTILDSENLKTNTILNVHLHNLPKEDSDQIIDQPINEIDQHNQIKSDPLITPSPLTNNQNLDQESIPILNQPVDSITPNLEIPQSNNVPPSNPSNVEPKIDEQLVDASLNKEIPDTAITEEIPNNDEEIEIEYPKHAKIINLKNKKILPDNIPQINEEPVLIKESAVLKEEIKDQLKKEDSSYSNDPLEYCQTNQLNRIQEEPRFYLIALRSVLGKFVEMLPEHMILFMETSLQVSTNLLMFVFLIGLLWIIAFTVKLFYILISKENKLKNYLCESQTRISLIQRERDDLRNKLNSQNMKLTKGLEEQRYEVNQLVNKLKNENKQLKDDKSKIEIELDDQFKLVKSLQTKIDQLNENNGNLFKENDELNEQLNDEITAKEELKKKLNNIDELNKELIIKNEEVVKQIEEHKSKIDYFNNKLDEQIKLTAEKEIEIGCLNKMLDELKESTVKDHDLDLNEQNEEIDKSTNSANASSVNFYDIVKLRCEIEKLEKERDESKDKLRSSLDKIELLEQKLDKLEIENSQFNETKSKVLKEKEEAEKYLDFLKKYYNENKNELQKELGVYQYKEKQLKDENKELKSKYENLEKKFEDYDQKCQAIKKEFEEIEKKLREELLTSNKSAGEYFKSVQALKAELTSVKKDNEYLRQQLRHPSASSKNKSSTIIPPPEMPKAVLEFFGQLSAGQIAASTASGLPNLSNLNGLNSINNFNNMNNISNPNFMTAPSPIPPQSLDYDYQQLAAANYHSSFSTLPFISQPQSQPSTSMYNNVISTSNANNFQQIIDPMMMAQVSSGVDVYNQQDNHYASLPNINYSDSQHPSIDQTYNQSIIQQQNQWNTNRTDNYTPLNQTGNLTSISPIPSLTQQQQQQNQWNHNQTDNFKPLDQSDNLTSQSPRPSLHNV